MGGLSYLMIETGGTSNPSGKTLDQNPVWLRFNVEDVGIAASELRQNGVSVKIRREVWGTVADFLDPDGNHCSLRDEASFEP
jgi:lactoylglutathione lyase